MKHSTTLRLAGLAACAALTASLTGCSSSNANPSPTVFDSGSDTSTPTPDASKSADTGVDSTSPTQDAGSVGDADAATPQDGGLIDGSLPDVGACTSDAATCNSCYTPAQNPLNGCSPASVNCIPFDNTRVPTGAP
jgi:hypothetical protein